MCLLLCKFSWCWMMEKRLNPNLNKFLQFLHISLSSCLSCTVWDKPRGGECYFCIFGTLRGRRMFLSDVMWMVEIKHWHQMKTDNGYEQPGEILFLWVKSVILTKQPVLSCHPPNVYFSPQTACRRNNWSQVRSGFGWIPVLLDVLLQLLAGGVSGNLDQMSIGSREVRVSSVRKYQWDKSGNSNKKICSKQALIKKASYWSYLYVIVQLKKPSILWMSM